MGVLNVTPDSFADGGLYLQPDAAVAQGRRLITEGADIVDVGGESTRPGSEGVAPEEQMRRVVPVIRGIRKVWTGPISIDTTRADVAAAAFEAGANWVNDTSALRDDPELAGFVAAAKCVVILMHRKGPPRTMQVNPVYADVVDEVAEFLKDRAGFAQGVGVAPDHVVIDPGIGFGKTVPHNLALLHGLPHLIRLGYPVLVGASRKSFIGQLTDAPPAERLEGSLAAAILAAQGGAKILRVHDVASTRRALTVAGAITAGPSAPPT